MLPARFVPVHGYLLAREGTIPVAELGAVPAFCSFELAGHFEQMNMTVVVEGMPFDHLMIKLKGQDRTWAGGL